MTKIYFKMTKITLKKKGVNKIYFLEPFIRKYSDLDIQNTFLNFGNFYAEYIF